MLRTWLRPRPAHTYDAACVSKDWCSITLHDRCTELQADAPSAPWYTAGSSEGDTRIPAPSRPCVNTPLTTCPIQPHFHAVLPGQNSRVRSSEFGPMLAPSCKLQQAQCPAPTPLARNPSRATRRGSVRALEAGQFPSGRVLSPRGAPPGCSHLLSTGTGGGEHRSRASSPCGTARRR